MADCYSLSCGIEDVRGFYSYGSKIWIYNGPVILAAQASDTEAPLECLPHGEGGEMRGKTELELSSKASSRTANHGRGIFSTLGTLMARYIAM